LKEMNALFCICFYTKRLYWYSRRPPRCCGKCRWQILNHGKLWNWDVANNSCFSFP
jgi:hypothetical protein